MMFILLVLSSTCVVVSANAHRSEDFVNADGIIVNREDDVYALTAQWHVVVTIDKPTSPDPLLNHLNDLYTYISKLNLQKINDSGMALSWIQRVNRLNSKLNSFDYERTAAHRPKRGLFNFIGSISKSLFGTATTTDVNRLRALVSQVHASQVAVTHLVNDMVTVVNQTYSTLVENRRHINALVSRQDSVISMLKRMNEDYYWAAQRLEEVRVHIHMETAIEEAELLTDTYMDSVIRFHNQRLALEENILSEHILPRAELEKILKVATTVHDFSVISPVEWYYTHVHVLPLWNRNDNYLMYSATLPLVSNEQFIAYNIKTYPIPVGFDTLASLQVSGRYAYDTNNGYMFPMTHCFGNKPVVCDPQVLHDRLGLPCPRGVITNSVQLRDSCLVKLQKLSNCTLVLPHGFNAYVLITTTVSHVTKHCIGKPEAVTVYSPGLHHINVSHDCTVKIPTSSGETIILKGLFFTTSVTHITHANVLHNITFGLPTFARKFVHTALSFKNISLLNEIPPTVPLSQLRSDQPLLVTMARPTYCVLSIFNTVFQIVFVVICAMVFSLGPRRNSLAQCNPCNLTLLRRTRSPRRGKSFKMRKGDIENVTPANDTELSTVLVNAPPVPHVILPSLDDLVEGHNSN